MWTYLIGKNLLFASQNAWATSCPGCKTTVPVETEIYKQ
ncbi:MAG: hypothetical protein CH6_0593 [Candidatus Kapaibacterium sp.]|nr:MAG: hypothetical protein CH6_0593 [Candidatus Kapabacteria bacterium]